MKNSVGKIHLKGYDDLFGGGAVNPVPDGEQAVEVALSELYPFEGHPFHVNDDEVMAETVESIKRNGVLIPGIARPRKGGGYELIAGHRRKRGSELAGLSTMPVFIRDYSDEDAVLAMVDTNIQRENILPSEKAKAYQMKYEAMKRKGARGDGRMLDCMGDMAGESGKTVQRYIWLARLTDSLLEMVDTKKLGFVQGVDISFLDETQQGWVQEVLQESNAAVSTKQSAQLKEYGKSGELSPAMVRLIVTQEKPKERRFTLKGEKISRYFPEEYSSEEIEDVIIGLLEEWNRGRSEKLQ